MDPRSHQRLSTTLIPTEISGIEGLRLQTSGRILDASCRGLRLAISEPVPAGSRLRLELEDSTIFGEVRYCQEQRGWYIVGLFVEEMVIGGSELARLLAHLIDETDVAEREAIRLE